MPRISFIVPLVLAACCSALSAAEFTVKQSDDGVTVNLDGKLFTNYVNKSGNKPILWPLIGPTGKEMTRQHPMREAAKTERADHPHHRSFWFTHGDVNGVSFWHENKGSGEIKHREFTKVAGGETATIAVINDWLGPDGKKICETHENYTFGADDKQRWIDAVLTVKASEDHDVKFGDTKEGAFGVRVAGTMKTDAKLGGTIVNSHGQTNAEAWGKASPWVDYYGPVEGETVGIAILNHPESFRFPTHWHVRTYGLFAANPFGLHDFPGGKNADGSHTLKPGESFTLRYRVLLHQGDDKQADIAKAFERYAKEVAPNN